MTNFRFNNKLFLCAVFAAGFCFAVPGYGVVPDEPEKNVIVQIGTFPAGTASEEPATGLAGWLGTYNKTFKMHNASIITTVFGSAFVAFFIALCWGKLVELYGALGGLLGGGIIVATFWVMNHKLPGFGIGHDGFPRPLGDVMGGVYQYGLIVQTGPWIDMGCAVCAGLFVASFLERLHAKKLDSTLPGGSALLCEVAPRAICVILGGIVGGAIVGLIGFTGARLF